MSSIFDSSRNIISILGLESLSEKKRAAILEKAVALVDARVTARLLERLDESALAEAEAIRNDGAKLAAFFAARMPDLGTVVEEEIAKVREELAGVVAALH